MTKKLMTRRCFDPWEYLEFRSDGRVAPCCARESFSESFSRLSTFRNSAEYRTLRRQLIDGNLDFKCSTCPFREKISVEQYKKELQTRFPQLNDPLTPPPHMAMVRIDFTERCNLRCTYCAASQPDYLGVESSEHSMEGGREMAIKQLESIIEALLEFKNINEITVNGHGETTSYKGWEQHCSRLQDLGLQLTITSNFSRLFNDREIVVLSRFKSITISIDTDDPVMLKKIRRKVNLGDILVNITKIRAKAMAVGKTPPDFIFLSGIYDKNVIRLPEFAWFAVACEVKEVSFWKLLKRPDIPGVENVYPIFMLERERLLTAYHNMKRTKQILEQNGVRSVFTGGILEETREQCNDFINIAVRKKIVDDQSIYLSLNLDPVSISDNEICNMYIAYEKGDTFYFVKETEIQPYPWDRESEAPPFRETLRTAQDMEIRFPLHEEFMLTENSVACYVGCGKSISEVMEYKNYIQISNDN